MSQISLFTIIPEDFFKPLTSKYKSTYMDCLRLIYNTYKTELSFGVDKEILVAKLENYLDDAVTTDMVFEKNEEVARDARAKANGILRELKDCGWIDFEVSNDFKVKVNLLDYAATMIESFNKIIKNEEMEYQSLFSQIHATLCNDDAYAKPYEYIIKRIAENTEELMGGFKKLNSNIKKRIDAITNEKSAGEIVQDFFVYHKEIGSKAYHRMKTSDNISRFRATIIEKLQCILNDENIFNRTVLGFIEVEQVDNRMQAEDEIRSLIVHIIKAFRDYDEIIREIDIKNSKYIQSAVARAKFLLNNSNNPEGKISKILQHLSEEFNNDQALNLYDEVDDTLFEVFQIFPQAFLDNESLYVVPISKKMSVPDELEASLGLTEAQRALHQLAMREKHKNSFSRKNINAYVSEMLKNNTTVLASTLPLQNKRDLIRIIFISLYAKQAKSAYKTISKDGIIERNGFKFCDFEIERCDK
ncbi:MAG: hypothetical protein H7Y41_02300 [Hyphomonadaceae bacterium]|nr:hypothetical protein [Clostridia bacterium]